MNIDQLIQFGIEEREKQRQDRAKSIEEQLTEISRRLSETLGEAWEELKPFAKGKYSSTYGTKETNGVKVSWVTFDVAAQEKRLVPFRVKIDDYGAVRVNDHRVVDPLDFGMRLMELRESFDEWEKEQKKKEITKLSDRLKYYWQDVGGAEAMFITNALCELDKSRAAEWEELFKTFNQKWGQKRGEEKARTEVEARKVDAADEYRSALNKFREQFEAVLHENRRLVAEAQAKVPKLLVSRLIYGTTSMDEDGTAIVKEQAVAVIEQAAIQGMLWTIACHGVAEKRRYFNLISLSDQIELDPLKNGIPHFDVNPWGYVYFNHGLRLVHGPNISIEEIIPDLMEWPEEPSAPEILSYREANSIKYEVLGDLE